MDAPRAHTSLVLFLPFPRPKSHHFGFRGFPESISTVLSLKLREGFGGPSRGQGGEITDTSEAVGRACEQGFWSQTARSCVAQSMSLPPCEPRLYTWGPSELLPP